MCLLGIMNTMDNNKTLLTILVIFVLVAIVGFYVAFDKIATLSTTISNLQLTQQIKNQGTASTPIPTPAPTTQTTSTNQSAVAQPDLVAKISTAIIFETNSSSALLPQASTTLTIENISKMSDGSIVADIKAFTSNATSYTAIDPKEIFFVVNTDGNSETATQVNGRFQSMPPKSSVSGQVIFKPSTARDSYIIQVGTGDDTKFYEFDFVKKSYKETVIG